MSNERTREARRMTVERSHPKRQEWDREVAVEIWHNTHQTTILQLSPDEAATLRDLLTDYLSEPQS